MSAQPNKQNRSYWVDFIFIALFSIPGLTWLYTTDNLASYFLYENLDGQFLYVISKLVGLYAMLFIWLQLLLGLVKPYLPDYFKSEIPAFHKRFGMASLVMIVLHILLFVTAVSLRNDHIAWALLIPKFTHGYYPLMLTMGLFAVASILVAVIARGMLRRVNVNLATWIHRLNLLAFYLILIHSYTIGSESRTGLMPILYLVMLSSITGLLLYRAITWSRHKINLSLR